MRNWLRPRAESRREDDGSVSITLEMPGFTRDEIGIEVDGSTLTVNGERKAIANDAEYLVRERYYGSFCRTYNLGQQIDSEHIEAKLADGILQLNLPIREQAKPRKIPVISN